MVASPSCVDSDVWAGPACGSLPMFRARPVLRSFAQVGRMLTRGGKLESIVDKDVTISLLAEGHGGRYVNSHLSQA